MKQTNKQIALITMGSFILFLISLTSQILINYGNGKDEGLLTMIIITSLILTITYTIWGLIRLLKS